MTVPRTSRMDAPSPACQGRQKVRESWCWYQIIPARSMNMRFRSSADWGLCSKAGPKQPQSLSSPPAIPIISSTQKTASSPRVARAVERGTIPITKAVPMATSTGGTRAPKGMSQGGRWYRGRVSMKLECGG
ncbi:hypothetical protein ES703_124799 [subsurface metagenome]